MEGFKLAFDMAWQFFNLPFNIGDYNLKLWYFPAFGVLLGLILKILLGGDNSGNK